MSASLGGRSSSPPEDIALLGPARSADRELVLLANDSMRARRAPLALLWMWAFQGVLAALATWPFIAIVGATYGSHPGGDGPLWRPGGLALLDLLDANSRVLRSLTPLPMIVLATTVILGLVPHALLLGQMTYATRSRRAARFAQLMPRALAAFGPMVFVLGAVTVMQGVVLVLGLAAGGSVSTAFASRLGEARAAQLGGLVTVLFLIGVSLLGVLQDLARAAIMRFQVGSLRSAKLALNTLRRSPVLVYWSWAWRALAMLLLLILGSIVAERATGTTSSIYPLVALHQGIVFGRLAFRASWLAKALRAVDLAHRVVLRKSPTLGERLSSPMSTPLSGPADRHLPPSI